MLVLNRKARERILIGDDVVLVVVAIEGDTAILGIEAPPGLLVDRAEVRAAIRRGEPRRDGRGG
jgi:carbon storage regulator